MCTRATARTSSYTAAARSSNPSDIGQAHNGGDWFADADLWAAFQEPLFGSDPLSRAHADVDSLSRLLEIEPGARILDACCGAGRHALELARRGFHVTGVDLNDGYVAQAAASAAAEGLAAEFLAGDVRTFCRPRAFDLAVNLYTSFGYFVDVRDDLLVLRNLRESLVAGGRVVIETTGKEIAARRGPRRSWLPVGDDGDFLLYEERILGAFERVELHWIRAGAGPSRQEARLSIRLYSAVELGSLLREAGFEETWVHGSLDGAAYDSNATALVTVARAPR